MNFCISLENVRDFFAFGDGQSCQPKALKYLFATPLSLSQPHQTLLKLVAK
jgi:hypothetical protein